LTPTDPIADDLSRFLDANVESMEQLEILRILGEAPETQWSVSELVRAAQIQPSAIAAQLAALEQRGLLKTQVLESHLHCKYAPRTPEIGQLLERLLQFYKERPVTLIRLVYARANDKLKAFAESFRLRKES
jgi:DNA-binding MarR family transcriptional regulator